MISSSRPRQLKDEHSEKHLFNRRIWLSFGLVMFTVFLLLLRYVQLQVVEHESLTAKSEQNRIKLQAVPPNRGLVYDRNGTLLADNLPAYRLELIPERVEDIDATLDRLADLVEITDAQRARFQRLRGETKPFKGVPIRFTLNELELARFSVNHHLFPGVDAVPYLIRHYPHGELLTHVLGYVGRISAGDLSGLDTNDYRGSTHIGVTGVEQFQEKYLHGTSGIEHVETNARGRVLNTQFRQDPKPGEDLYLTLDLELQRAAWDALGDAPGAVVAIDPSNGDVLALVSKPGFDPNLFVNGISSADYQAILDKPGRALFNRALQGTYEPGSTMKPFVALAGLENGSVTPDTLVFSNGEFFLPNNSRPYRDWLKGGHGWVTLKNALEQSVNTYFYQLAANLGIEALHDYLAQFGFGTATGVDLNGESAGLNPSPEWKRRSHGESWYPGETVIAGIGQGFNLVTPLQLASATATLAAKGQRFQLRLLGGVATKSGDRLVFPPQKLKSIDIGSGSNWNAVASGMQAVVHGVRGTGRGIGLDSGYRIAGKTGTAQVFALDEGEEYEEAAIPTHLRHHALFIAYAPADNPTIAVAVVAEHGGAGSRVAAPIAREILDEWILREDG